MPKILIDCSMFRLFEARPNLQNHQVTQPLGQVNLLKVNAQCRVTPLLQRSWLETCNNWYNSITSVYFGGSWKVLTGTVTVATRDSSPVSTLSNHPVRPEIGLGALFTRSRAWAQRHQIVCSFNCKKNKASILQRMSLARNLREDRQKQLQPKNPTVPEQCLGTFSRNRML